MTNWLNRLVLALAVMIMAQSAQAQGPVTPSGAGTLTNPYQISQMGHLVWLGENVSSSSGKYYTVQNNIDAAATAGWSSGAGFVPIWGFKGTFDGNNKVISGLTIHLPSFADVGLFGTVDRSGEVKDLGLAAASVTGTNHVGGLVGSNSGTISRCYASATVTGTYSAGGLVGWNDGNVSGCYATGPATGVYDVGGLVGLNSSGTVSKCYATGPVIGTYYVGGLVGDNYSGTMDGCHATGSVTGYWWVGGLAGSSDRTVSGCYAAGPVAGNSDVGGLIGLNYSGTARESYATGSVTGPLTEGNDVGGLVGYNNGGTVSVCYAMGPVTGTNSVGGLVGYNNGGTVGDSYWDTNTTGKATSGGGIGLTTAQMKQQATFAGWNFASVWRITENVTYPFLQRRGLFATATDLGGSWKWLSWFGFFSDTGDGWIYHNEHHWMYCVGVDPSNIWFYTLDMGWLWTSSATYPYLFRNNDGAWLYYLVGSSGPRWFYDYKTSLWEKH